MFLFYFFSTFQNLPKGNSAHSNWKKLISTDGKVQKIHRLTIRYRKRDVSCEKWNLIGNRKVDYAKGSGECISWGGRKVSEGNEFVLRTTKNLASCSCVKI